MKRYKYIGRSDPKIGEEIIIEVADLETLEKSKAKAVVSPKTEDLPSSDELWLEDEAKYETVRADNPWRIKIIEWQEEEEEEIEMRPRQQVSLGKRKGAVLTSLIREREKKE